MQTNININVCFGHVTGYLMQLRDRTVAFSHHRALGTRGRGTPLTVQLEKEHIFIDWLTDGQIDIQTDRQQSQNWCPKLLLSGTLAASLFASRVYIANPYWLLLRNLHSVTKCHFSNLFRFMACRCATVFGGHTGQLAQGSNQRCPVNLPTTTLRYRLTCLSTCHWTAHLAYMDIYLLLSIIFIHGYIIFIYIKRELYIAINVYVYQWHIRG